MRFIKAIIFLLLSIILLPTAVSAQTGLKVLSYNVLYGLQNDSVTKQSYVEWVKQKDPDIVAYQEMNDFTQKGLEAFAAQYGHAYAVLSKTDGFPVALTSKYPIVNTQKVVDNMWHAYIYANVNGNHVFVIHFSPFSYQKRRHEVAEVLARAALIPQEEPIMIMGDFNSLSADDADAYDEAFLESRREAERQREIVRNLDNGKLDYSVTDAMKKAGFQDAIRLFHQDFQRSAPTQKYFKGTMQRIDYLWVNDVLAQRIRSADFIYDDVTDTISDHYPLFVTFDTASPPTR